MTVDEVVSGLVADMSMHILLGLLRLIARRAYSKLPQKIMNSFE